METLVVLFFFPPCCLLSLGLTEGVDVVPFNTTKRDGGDDGSNDSIFTGYIEGFSLSLPTAPGAVVEGIDPAKGLTDGMPLLFIIRSSEPSIAIGAKLTDTARDGLTVLDVGALTTRLGCVVNTEVGFSVSI